jgi:hypothetical protein
MENFIWHPFLIVMTAVSGASRWMTTCGQTFALKRFRTPAEMIVPKE